MFAGYLANLPVEFSAEAAYILNRYRADDWTWLPAANGVFAFAVSDPDRGRCVLGVDRLGIRPLLFAHADAGVAFGHDLSVLRSWSDRSWSLDHDSLQELLVVGFPLSERTVLSGIERVPPGTWIDCRGGSRQIHSYWSVADLGPIREQPPDQFVDETREHLRQSLARLAKRFPGPALCLLSSGYDSRRMLLEGRALGMNLSAVTSALPFADVRGQRATIEPAVTRELCRRVGVPHRIVGVPGGDADVGEQEAHRLRDALLDFQVPGSDHAWFLPLLASLTASSTLRNLDGMGGDTLYQNPFFHLPRDVWGRWAIEPRLLDAIAIRRDAADRLWGGLVSRSLTSRLRDTLAALPEGPYRLSFFYLLGRTRRVAALLTYGLLDLRIESVCPYLDSDLLEHAHSIDPLVKAALGGQRQALERHFPDFTDIPTSHSAPDAVAAPYVDPIEPTRSSRLTLSDVVAAAGSRRAPGPPIQARDLAFGLIDSIGLGHLGGQWRQGRVRDAAYVGRTWRHLVGAPASALLSVRRGALARVARIGSRAEQKAVTGSVDQRRSSRNPGTAARK